MMPRSLARIGLALLCLCSIPAARADIGPSEMPAFGDPSTAVDLSGNVTIENCVAQALGRNFNVKIQWFTVLQSEDSVVIQQAAFEPTFGFNANKTVDQTATSEAIPGTIPYTSITSSTFSLSDTVITGGTVAASYGLGREYFAPEFSLPDPAYGDTASLSVTQPLLNGAGTDYNSVGIETAKLGVRISNLNFKSAVLTMILNVETTYYNLLFQREQYKVQLEELKQAQQLLDENTIRRETGVQTDLDVTNARAGVAAAKNLLILDEQAVHNSEDDLLQLLGDRQFTTAVGAISFPFVGEPEVSFDRSYKLARDNGPNLAVAQATIDQFKLAALKAKRSMLPTLNLNGGLGYSSYASTAGASITGNWSGYNWTAGLTVSVPWGLTAGRAAYRQAIAGVRSQQVAYDEADQSLVVGVRAAVRAVETGIASVRSSAENTEFAEKAYELTKAQFDAGLATSYLVLQSQNTLETARVSELQAKVNLLSAIANLRFLEGSSLPLYRINLPE
jgi:outer membrane protein TolC